MDGGAEGDDDGIVDLDELDEDESDDDEEGEFLHASRTNGSSSNSVAPWASNDWIRRFAGPPPEAAVTPLV